MEGYDNAGKLAAFMLNTDYEIFYDLSLDNAGKLTCNLAPTCGLDDSCRPGIDCPKENTFDLALAYANVSVVLYF
jgi:hypothetical protein